MCVYICMCRPCTCACQGLAAACAVFFASLPHAPLDHTYMRVWTVTWPSTLGSICGLRSGSSPPPYCGGDASCDLVLACPPD